MPELPEVEITRLSIAQRLEGARITGLRLGKPLRRPLGCSAASLRGLRVGRTLRRGKYLWLELERGGLLLHLGMSGSLHLHSPHPPAAPGPHDHFDLETTQGTLRLTDPRRFGAVVWSEGLAAEPAAAMLRGLGIEPFDPAFDGAWLHAALRKRRGPIKPILLGGAVVVGAGNIYACEALFAAGIDPRTPAGRLGRLRCARLAAALRDTLARALALGGSTLRDFRDADGEPGAFQLAARVYGRGGEPCSACGRPIRRIVQGQRATYYCPRCQRR